MLIVMADDNTGGRPTKYDESVPLQMLEYFTVEDTREIETEYTNKKGETWSKIEEVSNRLPTFAGFARKIGVHRDTLDEWKKVHPAFSDTYKLCKEIQEELLVNNALRGFYNPAFSIFFAKNNLGYKDKTETDLTMKKDAAAELAGAMIGSSEDDSHSNEGTAEEDA